MIAHRLGASTGLGTDGSPTMMGSWRGGEMDNLTAQAAQLITREHAAFLPVVMIWARDGVVEAAPSGGGSSHSEGNEDDEVTAVPSYENEAAAEERMRLLLSVYQDYQRTSEVRAFLLRSIHTTTRSSLEFLRISSVYWSGLVALCKLEGTVSWLAEQLQPAVDIALKKKFVTPAGSGGHPKEVVNERGLRKATQVVLAGLEAAVRHTSEHEFLELRPVIEIHAYMKRITATYADTPSELKLICSFLFLRMLCPMLVSPVDNGLLKLPEDELEGGSFSSSNPALAVSPRRESSSSGHRSIASNALQIRMLLHVSRYLMRCATILLENDAEIPSGMEDATHSIRRIAGMIQDAAKKVASFPASSLRPTDWSRWQHASTLLAELFAATPTDSPLLASVPPSVVSQYKVLADRIRAAREKRRKKARALRDSLLASTSSTSLHGGTSCGSEASSEDSHSSHRSAKALKKHSKKSSKSKDRSPSPLDSPKSSSASKSSKSKKKA